jgi:hypothetical protein
MLGRLMVGFKSPNIVKVILWILLIFVITVSASEFLWVDFVTEKSDSIIKLHAAGIMILTVILILVAQCQLGHLSQTSKADFLLRIDERYGSMEIIKAKKVIHRFYCDTIENAKDREDHIRLIAEKIRNFEKKGDGRFIYLLNFLDFLETVAYFCNKKYISNKDVEELIGGSIEYFYKLFKIFIWSRREESQDCKYYCEIEMLAKKMGVT